MSDKFTVESHKFGSKSSDATERKRLYLAGRNSIYKKNIVKTFLTDCSFMEEWRKSWKPMETCALQTSIVFSS